MNKSRTRTISIIVLLPVIGVMGYIALSSFNKFNVFEQFYTDANTVIHDISNMEIGADAENQREYIDEWNKKANDKLNAFYASYGNVSSKEVKDSIEFTRELFREVFSLRLNYVDVIEPMYSKRMQDHQTVRDKEEFEWRIQTLDNIMKYLITYEDDLNNSIDNFRQSIAGSNWSDKYREYAWQEWGRDVKPHLSSMLPDMASTEERITKYQRFFDYMYDNREVYYVGPKGEFIFRNQRNLKESLGVINTMESDWRKYTVINPLN